ncbi:MAG: hypothetical protein GXP17_00130 [Gammaproteobacteria bacterium]|nr:hypothetical protein [Gammaproteobacteria bacterium]
MAVNVFIKPIIVDETSDIIIKFEGSLPLLKKDETLEINAESFHGENSKGDLFLAHLDPSSAVKNLTMDVNYENIESKKYSVKITTSPGSRKILGITEK